MQYPYIEKRLVSPLKDPTNFDVVAIAAWCNFIKAPPKNVRALFFFAFCVSTFLHYYWK